MKSDYPIEKNAGTLELSPQQQEVLSALRSSETDQNRLSRWYLGALYAINNPYNPDRISQAAQSLRELVEKLPRIFDSEAQFGSQGLRGMRDGLNLRFEKDKKRYEQGWKDRRIDGHLDKTLRRIDRYLELNRAPSRSEQIQQGLTKIDPLVNQLDQEVQIEKRDRILDLWRKLEEFAHHRSSLGLSDLMDCLETFERAVLDLLAPITAEDQLEILSILNQFERSENDVSRMLTLIKRRGANYTFFFKHASDAAWIPILDEEGYFSHPPGVEPIGEGRLAFPIWVPIQYLSRVAIDAPNEVVQILKRLPPVDNPWVYDGILDAALCLRGSQSAKLLSKMLEYARLDFHVLAHRFPSLLTHWATENQTSATLGLARALIRFVPDRKDSEKRARYKEDATGLLTHLEPVPRFESWDYREILTTGIRPLVEKEPCKTACMLIDAVARMVYLGMHQDQIDRDGDEDYSEIWFPRLIGKYEGYGEPKELLIYTMTSACEKVFDEDPDSIAALDERLRKQRWKLFKRLRQHLYAHYPTEQTKPWIREMIRSHEDFERSEYHYEFQLMIRLAVEHYREGLLSENKRTSIFNSILHGPSKENFKEQYGERFTESLFAQRQRRFHRMQLKPFASVLFGRYQEYFHELEAEADDRVADEDYSPVSEPEARTISRGSPISPQELAAKSDREILDYINAWQEERPYEVDEDGSFVDISIEGLAEAYQTTFKESILPDDNRLRYWIENRDNIERPIYVRAIVDGMRMCIEERGVGSLDESLEFCEWVLTHPDQEREHDFGRGEQSRTNPNWARARQAVGDLVHTCSKRKVNAPISAKGCLTKLLELLCTQYDWQLDKEDPDYFGSNDYLTTAINNTRSRALEYLMEFGDWLERNDPATDFDEVKKILLNRIALESELPLTLPEHAILGANYTRLLGFDETWALEHRTVIFPQKKLHDWQVAFGSYLRRYGPNIRAFDVLRKEYDFGVQQLTKIKGRDDSDREFSDYLGRHLFFYYLWGLYPLEGEDSLLELFYKGTKIDRKRWSNLIDHLGLVLENTEESLDEDLKRGLAEFFEWRLDAGEKDELGHFSSWLEADCLEPEWRLDALSRVLDATRGSTSRAVSITAKALEEMLPEHTTKVVECFAKLTNVTDDSTFYVDVETAKRIVQAGLESSNEDVRKNAERARNSLLNRAYFDLLDLQD